MRREEKSDIINSLAETLKEYSHFYLTDTAQLNAADTSDLRRKCFENQIKLVVVKNTLLKRALEQAGLECGELVSVLKGSTAVMFSNNGNTPAKLIKEFRKSHPKPLLKGAFIEESVYVGDNLLDTLVALKSREELIADIIMLLQSPAKNVISALQSGGSKIHGVLETLSKKE
ncbi:MAG TPA: 50S ribosomal protein L10 [Bacteroidales bacterium]|jgi:large subunit ribosomal protein L10|nr:50S ribosomal protein L10 [Bacteroidales bacterium]NLD64654.1 50S ribosomal protein L10 [Bacteroidales bacterium]HPE21405.1 50S ribosomal protein L10 [Bacteroidales bacterium]HPJ05949.1 50S ribosomal protein L10 [Bacteroidales bacterium]